MDAREAAPTKAVTSVVGQAILPAAAFQAALFVEYALACSLTNKLLRAELLVDIFGESLPARQPRGTLRHCGARAIKTTERQNIDLAQQVSGIPSGELLLELVVGEVIRVQRRLLVGREAAGSPAIAAARPAHFVLIELVLASAPGARSEARRDHDGVLEGSIQKSGRGEEKHSQRGSSHTSRTQRKLIFVVELSGVLEVLAATRYRLQYDLWQRYDPPFITLAEPSSGPTGFFRVAVT
jgi:hypothetical protein